MYTRRYSRAPPKKRNHLKNGGRRQKIQVSTNFKKGIEI
jgi:hypothetical protein